MTTNFNNIIRDLYTNIVPVAMETSARRRVEYYYPLGKEYNTWKKGPFARYSEKTGRRLKDGIGWIMATVTKELIEEKMTKELERETTIHVKVKTDDSMRVLGTEYGENVAEHIYNALGEYADHLVKFEPRYYKYFGEHGPALLSGFYPVFEGEWNDKFYKAMDDYMERKAAWCNKYGCD